MKKLIKFLMKYWKIAIFSPLLMMVEVGIDLYQPMLMKNIIDVGIKEMNIDVVKTYAFYMLGLSLVGMLSSYISGIVSVYSSQSAGADIRDQLFKKVQSLSFANLDKIKTSSMITRLTNDVVQIQSFFQQLMRIMVRAPFMLVGSIALTFYVSLKFGSILIALIAVLLVFVLIIIKQARPLFKKTQKQVDSVNNVMLENIKGIRVIKAFVRQKEENERFNVENQGLMDVQTKASRKFAMVMPMIMLTVNLVIVAVLWFGSYDVVSGSITVGEIVAVINYITRLLFALMMTGMIFFRISRAQASAERINEVLDMEADITYSNDQYQTIQGKVTFDNVSFKYATDSSDCVLSNINFEVNQGETLAIIGATGSGKSTLMQLIPRFYDVTQGKILIDDCEVGSFSKASLREQIAFVNQHAFIFSGDIKSNVFFDGKVDDQVMEDSQSQKIMDEKGGYHSEIKQRGSNLSGGQKQRISIARGLAIKPKILLLDDATSALDAKTEFAFKKALKERYKDTTIIMVAQRISSVMTADKIMVIEDGKVAALGGHDDLLASSDLYRDIYESQLGKVIS